MDAPFQDRDMMTSSLLGSRSLSCLAVRWPSWRWLRPGRPRSAQSALWRPLSTMDKVDTKSKCLFNDLSPVPHLRAIVHVLQFQPVSCGIVIRVSHLQGGGGQGGRRGRRGGGCVGGAVVGGGRHDGGRAGGGGGERRGIVSKHGKCQRTGRGSGRGRGQEWRSRLLYPQ